MIDEIIQSGVISAEDASSLMGKAVFLDCTFVLPSSDDDIQENYIKEHIPSAYSFDIEAVSRQDALLAHMLPFIDVFETAMRSLGVNNDDFVIVYGQHGLIMGPARVWWMMKGFGHDRVVVLDGGLPAWIKAGFCTEAGTPPTPELSDYSAVEFDRMAVLSLEDMIAISDSALCPILDARPATRFKGESPEPRAGMRSGHIPNSNSLPCSMIVNEEGRLKSKKELSKLFSDFDLSGRVATTCGSGITACALALALHHIGFSETAVYDGSWSEWGHNDSGTRIER